MVLVLHIDEALRFLLVGPAAESDVYILVVDSEPAVWLVAGICVGLGIRWESHVASKAIVVVNSLLQVVDLFLVNDSATVELLILRELSSRLSRFLDDLWANLIGTYSNHAILLLVTLVLKLVILDLEGSKVLGAVACGVVLEQGAQATIAIEDLLYVLIGVVDHDNLWVVQLRSVYHYSLLVLLAKVHAVRIIGLDDVILWPQDLLEDFQRLERALDQLFASWGLQVVG